MLILVVIFLRKYLSKIFESAALIRRFILSWLMAALVEYLLLPAPLRSLQGLAGLAEMSLVRVLFITAAGVCLLSAIGLWEDTGKAERWCIVAIFALLSLLSLAASFSWAFLILCVLVLAVLTVYALMGWNNKPMETYVQKRPDVACIVVTGLLTVGFTVFVSIWTVSRVLCFSTPTYDMGIFSQMFYSMRTTGLPITTVERDGPLSHFMVHVSPIYYLMLPFYCLFPKAETLQVLQAVVLASSVIPLWLLAGRKNLPAWQRTALCALLLFYPALSGGTSYDLHENCFLTPLLLWLFYALERRSLTLTVLFSLLTLGVKEDAAVYVAVAALYWIVKALLNKEKKDLFTGIGMLAAALIWFFAVTGFLAAYGDGVMTYRYDNFIYDGSGSLLTVVKSVLLEPMKALFECVDPEKLAFIGFTMLPLLGLPFFTRRFERYLLFIPYVLINLMSDYRYQHDIFFQYTFGATAFLFYMAVLNLADMKLPLHRLAALAGALVLTIGAFFQQVYPVGIRYPQQYKEYEDYYTYVRQTLDLIPKDASLATTTYYTTYLCDRDALYDVKYCSKENLLSCEYVALHTTSTTNYTRYAVNGERGYENLVAILEENGYTVFATAGNYLVIYVKTAG